jgi:ABC-type Na+ efflux pump permease subunit
MGSRATIARRELAGLRAEKTIVLALAIQLFIAAFSSFLVVGLVSMYDPGELGGAEVDVAVTGEAVDRMEAAAAEVPGVRTRTYEDAGTAHDAFDARVVDAVLETDRREGRIHVDATVPDSDVRTTVVVVQLREVLRTLEASERDRRVDDLESRPLDVPDRTGSSPYYGFTYTVLVPLLVFLPVFISGSLAVDSVTEEIDRGTMELLRVAPVTIAEILDGKALTAVGIVPAQVAAWLALLWINGTPVANVGWLLVLATAVAAVVVELAVAVALLVPDRRGAQLLYSVGVLAVFAGSSLAAGGPVNAAARLAIDSADLGVYLVVVGAVALACVSVAAVRLTLDRRSPAALG